MAETALPSTRSEQVDAPPVIGVKLQPRAVTSEHDPGHMGVTWKTREGRFYRGFRFKLTDLPKEKRDASQWRSFLFENTVPGYIMDDLMLEDAVTRHGEKVLCLQWTADAGQVKRIEADSMPREFGYYSFEPGKHRDCHNCVTWAISAVNAVLGEVLHAVPNGRIKRAVEMLQKKGAQPSA